MNFIDTVFEWLLTATLRASVLAVVILTIQFVLRRWLPAGWRHALWLPMLAVLVLPVLPEAPFGLFPRTAARPALDVADVAIPDGLTGASDHAAPATSPASTMASAYGPKVAVKLHDFALAWLVGVCGVLAAGLIGYRRNLRRIRRNGIAPDRMLQAAIEEAAREASLKRTPQAMVSPVVASPAVTGFVRPLLLLPANFPEGFSVAETRLILLHEFTHLKRLDLPLNWLTCVLQAMHWFNPLLWFAFARMRADREAACDARVLSIDATDRRSEYGGALLKLQCVTPSRALSLGFVGIFERGSEIQARIRGIAAHRPGRFAWQATGGAILTLLLVFGVTKGQETKQAVDEKATAKEAAPVVPANGPGKEEILKKLNSIIIPIIDFEEVTVEQAIDFLRLRARELDPAKKGVNILILRPAPAEGAAVPRIAELRLRDVPLGNVIRYICEAARLRYTVDEFAVTLAPGNEAGVDPAVPANGPGKEEILKKLNSIIIPSIDFEEATVEEAIDFLRQRAKDLDPAKKGVNIVLRRPAPAEGAAVPQIAELRIRDVPLGNVIRYICEIAHLRYTVDEFAVSLAPRNEAGVDPAAPANR